MCVWQVEEALEGVKNATNEQDLANRFKEFGKEMVKLNYVAARRQQVTWRPTFLTKLKALLTSHIQAQGVPVTEKALKSVYALAFPCLCDF